MRSLLLLAALAATTQAQVFHATSGSHGGYSYDATNGWQRVDKPEVEIFADLDTQRLVYVGAADDGIMVEDIQFTLGSCQPTFCRYFGRDEVGTGGSLTVVGDSMDNNPDPTTIWFNLWDQDGYSWGSGFVDGFDPIAPRAAAVPETGNWTIFLFGLMAVLIYCRRLR